MRNEGLSILAAVGFHVVILVAARAMPPLTLSASEQKPLDIIEVGLDPLAPLPPAKATELAPPPPAPEGQRQVDPDRQPDARLAVRTSPNQNPQVPSTAETSPETNPQPPPASTQKGSQFDELPPERRGILGVDGVPGLGGNAVWTMPGVVESGRAPPPAPTVSPAARPVDKDIAGQVLRSALAERDKGMGLDLPAGGNVQGAVRTAVQGADLPDAVHGTIEFRLGPNGQVLGVRVLSANGGSQDAWQRVAKAAQAALAGRSFPMGQYAKGAVVTVDVTSNLQAPSGSKGGFQGTGVAFDVSNIGAHSTKHVRTSYSVAAIR